MLILLKMLHAELPMRMRVNDTLGYLAAYLFLAQREYARVAFGW